MIGISPGTRATGLALIKDGVLIDYGSKIFTAKWSAKKLAKVLTVLEEYIKRYKATCIAVKISHKSRTSKGLEAITMGVIDMAKRLNIDCWTYNTDQIKQYCNGSMSKQELFSYILQQYPEVEKGINLTLSSINYHQKTFEAIALAHILDQ